jgi:lysophospholipase L1-like esterase
MVVARPDNVRIPRLKAIGFRLVAVLLGLALAVLTAEGFVRLFVPSSLWAFWDSSKAWRLDPELGWAPIPNLDLTRREPHQGWILKIQTNADGVFPAATKRDKNPGVLRILMIGDSTVVGMSVPAEKRVNAVLERLLRSAGVNAEVINAGVEGYSTDQELLLLLRLLPLYHPDIVILSITQNDFGGNLVRTDFSAGGLPKPVFVLHSNGALEEIPPDMTNARVRSYASGAGKWVVQYSALYRLVQPQFFRVRAKLLGWENRNLLGLASEMYYRPAELERIDWKLFTALLEQIDRASRADGARFLCYLHPAPEEVWDPFIRDAERRLALKPGEYDRYAVEKRVARITQSEGIAFLRLIDLFMANQSRGPFHLLPRDSHSGPAGYQLIAEALARFLMNQDGVASRQAARGVPRTTGP